MKKERIGKPKHEMMSDVAEQLIRSLKTTGHEMIELSKRINLDDGHPLARYERELARMSMVPMLRECTDLLIAAFLAENNPEVTEEFRRLDTLIGLSQRL